MSSSEYIVDDAHTYVCMFVSNTQVCSNDVCIHFSHYAQIDTSECIIVLYGQERKKSIYNHKNGWSINKVNKLKTNHKKFNEYRSGQSRLPLPRVIAVRDRS